MRRIVIKLLCIAGFIAAALFSVPKKISGANDLILHNAEALANGESNVGDWCIGNGSLECHGRNVELKITGYR